MMQGQPSQVNVVDGSANMVLQTDEVEEKHELARPRNPAVVTAEGEMRTRVAENAITNMFGVASSQSTFFSTLGDIRLQGTQAKPAPPTIPKRMIRAKRSDGRSQFETTTADHAQQQLIRVSYFFKCSP